VAYSMHELSEKLSPYSHPRTCLDRKRAAFVAFSTKKIVEELNGSEKYKDRNC